MNNLTTLKLPVLPLRDIVVFPHMIVPLFVGREKSIKALEDVMSEDKKVLLLAQKDGSLEDPSEKDLFGVGTIGSVLQLLKLPDGTVKVLVEGISRCKVLNYIDNDHFLHVSGSTFEDYNIKKNDELKGMLRTVISQFELYAKLNKKITQEVLSSLPDLSDASKIADTISSNLNLKMSSKQELLEIIDIKIT